ncbi:hypothetical protein [Micromonospora sp. NPDC005299]|uniref:hypothetical protein n=1 Tax=Micromonospora sp. NPDC005299 TaxID=3364231 RepID=UPI0036C52158
MMELDGRSVAADELARLPLYNYGHFTTMRVDAGRVRGLSLHQRRLVNDCRTVFDAELDPATVCRFGSASPAVHRELDAVLRVHGVTGGPGWLIDMLALTRLRLQTAADPDQPATADGSAVKTRGD